MRKMRKCLIDGKNKKKKKKRTKKKHADVNTQSIDPIFSFFLLAAETGNAPTFDSCPFLEERCHLRGEQHRADCRLPPYLTGSPLSPVLQITSAYCQSGVGSTSFSLRLTRYIYFLFPTFPPLFLSSSFFTHLH